MTETFEFSTSWQEVNADRLHIDCAETHRFSVYAQGLDQHRKASEGRWVTATMVRPQVGELRGVSAGRGRVIRGSVDLWMDDRPPLSREEFSLLRRAAFGVIAGRGQEEAA